MRLSAVQMPDLIQTAMGGNRMARRPRKMSPLHMVLEVYRFDEEDGGCWLVIVMSL